jgi:hypothetical protein
MDFVCLDVFDDKVLAITMQVITHMAFSDSSNDGSNDWTKSKIRTWLNNEFIKRFNEDDLIIQTSDLTANNGEKKFGTCEDYITLITCEQYRKYKDVMPIYDDWMWTITPEKCNDENANRVCYVNSRDTSEDMSDSDITSFCGGLAPICLFNLDQLKSRNYWTGTV